VHPAARVLPVIAEDRQVLERDTLYFDERLDDASSGHGLAPHLKQRRERIALFLEDAKIDRRRRALGLEGGHADVQWTALQTVCGVAQVLQEDLGG
jgi:hypothetical protein